MIYDRNIEMNKKRKKYQQQNNDLTAILPYRKKKYIMPGALLLFLALLLLSVGLTLGIVAFLGDDAMETAREMFQLQNAVYLLPGFLLLGVPALLVYAVVSIGERRFLHVYREMPQEEKEMLYEKKIQEKHPGGLLIYEGKEYILFSDRCLFGTPQIVKLSDIVWGYIGHSDFQYTNMDQNVISPHLRFFSLYFYTADGRRHRIYVHVSYQEAIQWFISRCPKAVLGYGKEQKRRAEEIFRQEAERAAFLTGKKQDSYLLRKKRRRWAIAGSCLFAVLFLTAGGCLTQYVKSDEYLYRKYMKKAEQYFEQEEWSRAYQAYAHAGDYRKEDEEATKGMLLSRLGMAKNDGYIDSIIRDYEVLFSCQELFTDEMDISDWYFDCTEYYLKYDEPLKAVDLLDRGMDTFFRAETMVENRENEASEEDMLSGKSEERVRENILSRMENKKKDILAHCQIEATTEYIYGEKRTYRQYNETGQEILNVYYSNRYSIWIYKTYDKNGNMIQEETYQKEDGEDEKQKTGEEYYEYDEMGRLLHEERYDLQRGGKVYESVSRYDEAGNEIYHKEFYDGEIFLERECFVITDTLRIEREYNADYPEQQCSYMEEKRDGDGNLLERAFYGDSYSAEEIQNGEAAAQVRYRYAYDERGNNTALYYSVHEELGEYEPVYEREYDDRNHLVKEIYYYRDDASEDAYEDSYETTTVWYYNEEDLLVRKERNTSDDKETWPDYMETYTYNEPGELIRTDYRRGDGTAFGIVKEYDVLGNQVKEYRVSGDVQTVPEEEIPEKEWEYEYHYAKEDLGWKE